MYAISKYGINAREAMHGDTHFAEISCAEERLEKGVHVTGGTLVLQADIARLLFGVIADAGLSGEWGRDRGGEDSLDEIVPEHASRILQYTYKHANVSTIIFYCWPAMSILYAEELAQLAETRESPVAFLRDKPMVGIWRTVRQVDFILSREETHG